MLPQGSTEVWNLINTTPDNHPVHVHLIQFRLISRQNFDVDGYANGSCSFSNPLLRSCLIGAPVPAAPEEAGWHDTILTPPAEVTTILLKFATQVTAATSQLFKLYIIYMQSRCNCGVSGNSLGIA